MQYTLDGHDLQLMIKFNDGTRVMSILDDEYIMQSIGVCVLNEEGILAEVYYSDFKTPYDALKSLQKELPGYKYEFNIYLSGVLFAMRGRF